MDLFEKIDLFEKMANQLSESLTTANDDSESETHETIGHSTLTQARRASLKSRVSLLKTAIKL